MLGGGTTARCLYAASERYNAVAGHRTCPRGFFGFLKKFRAKDLHTFVGDTQQCDDEYVASSTGRFVHALIERLSFRSAWLLLGWPSRAALLLHDSTRYQVLAELKAHYETCEKLKAMDSRHLRGMQPRSPLRLPCVRQIVEPLRASGWAANHRVLETISL